MGPPDRIVTRAHFETQTFKMAKDFGSIVETILQVKAIAIVQKTDEN